MGSKKPLCYAVLPIVSDIMTGLHGSFVVVVSPLIVRRCMSGIQIQSYAKRGSSGGDSDSCRCHVTAVNCSIPLRHEILAIVPRLSSLCGEGAETGLARKTSIPLGKVKQSGR